jgi:hypothetical protein
MVLAGRGERCLQFKMQLLPRDVTTLRLTTAALDRVN